MKVLVEIIDFNGFMSSINVFRIRQTIKERAGYPFVLADYDLLEKLPYMKRDEVFECAVDLACRLRSAGFDVIMERGEKNESKEKTDCDDA